jgi:hypothetical protein
MRPQMEEYNRRGEGGFSLEKYKKVQPFVLHPGP